MDLIVRSGQVVTDGAVVTADILIRDGVIAQIASHVDATGDEIDAAGAYVLPGGVDAHTHLNSRWPPYDEPRRPVDDFEHGTRAAIAGGITTVCDFVYKLADASLEASVDEIRTQAESLACIDFGLHLVIEDTDTDIPAHVADFVASGLPSFKFYTNSPDYVHNAARYLDIMSAIARANGLAMFHCEDDAIADFANHVLRDRGETSVRDYPASKPPEVELSATNRALSLAAAAGAQAYLVHLSLASALDSALVRRHSGQGVYVETRPLYLHLTADQFDQEEREAAKYVGTPPLRAASDRDRLWEGLAKGEIDVVATDHVGFTLGDKYRDGDTFDDVPRGVANLHTMIPMLFSDGVRSGRLTIEQLVQLVSSNPARIFGLYPRKGVIAVGSDADLCVFDPNKSLVLPPSPVHSASDFEIYAGQEVWGWPRYTVSRGDVVFAEDTMLATPGRGRFVAGKPSAGPTPAVQAQS